MSVTATNRYNQLVSDYVKQPNHRNIVMTVVAFSALAIPCICLNNCLRSSDECSNDNRKYLTTIAGASLVFLAATYFSTVPRQKIDEEAAALLKELRSITCTPSQVKQVMQAVDKARSFRVANAIITEDSYTHLREAFSKLNEARLQANRLTRGHTSEAIEASETLKLERERLGQSFDAAFRKFHTQFIDITTSLPKL